MLYGDADAFILGRYYFTLGSLNTLYVFDDEFQRDVVGWVTLTTDSQVSMTNLGAHTFQVRYNLVAGWLVGW